MQQAHRIADKLQRAEIFVAKHLVDSMLQTP